MNMTVRQAIEQAADVLSEIAPDWEYRVNVSRLDMASFTDCVLGQVFGGFRAGLPQFASVPNGLDLSRRIHRGECPDMRGCLWTASRKVWTEVILERRARMEAKVHGPERPPVAKTQKLLAGCRKTAVSLLTMLW